MFQCTGPSIKYLQFRVNKKTYQFISLPFGLATSPREFTKLLRSVVAWLRQRGVKLHIYLNAWLMRRVSRTGPDAFRDDHLPTPEARMGYQLWEVRPNTKSGFPVSGNAFQHSIVYSGALPKMRLKVQSVHQHWMSNPIITARDLHRLLGMVVFMAMLVCRGRLRLQPIQWWAPQHGARGTGIGQTRSQFLSGFCKKWPGGHL